MLILCVLTLRVPSLRRQGFGCSGYLWRLGGCLFFNRKETIRELEFKEAERLKKDDGVEKGLVGGWLRQPRQLSTGTGSEGRSAGRMIQRQNPTERNDEEQTEGERDEEEEDDDDADSVVSQSLPGLRKANTRVSYRLEPFSE